METKKEMAPKRPMKISPLYPMKHLMTASRFLGGFPLVFVDEGGTIFRLNKGSFIALAIVILATFSKLKSLPWAKNIF